MKKHLIKIINTYRIGKKIFNDDFYNKTHLASQNEIRKRPRRSDIINYFLSLTDSKLYLEIGVRDPNKNFYRIDCEEKYSVDPGLEFIENPVDFKMTSDVFFKELLADKLKISKNLKFDVIFIDGLHLAEQVDKDIMNALEFLKDSGFIILHDCNPPTEFHQRESYKFLNSPSGPFWNGTTWKAFYKYRHNTNLYSICFDTDWGVGVLSKFKLSGFNQIQTAIENPYFEFSKLEQNREAALNLKIFKDWKTMYELAKDIDS
ncbi:MAG: class I SAM-dependent methyltransferase [Xanthomarina sp.]